MATSFERVWSRRGEIMRELKDLQRSAEANAQHELAAVTLIQAFRRGLVTRRMIARWKFCAGEIQRVYRGHVGREKVRRLLKEKQDMERMAFFHFQAISIQRIFRGFFSRRTLHDFYARKKYIASVLDQSRRVRDELQRHRASQEEELRKKESSDQRIEFDEITENLHHLLSTQSQPGIYNSPFIQEDLPTAFNQPIEDHIKTSFKRYISKKGGVETIGLQKMRERALRPMSRRSVQSETRYGIIEEAEKQKMRFDKLKQVSPRNWSVVGGIRHVHAPGIDAGTQYTELWRLARSSREVAKAEGPAFITAVRHGNDFQTYAFETHDKFKQTMALDEEKMGGTR